MIFWFVLQKVLLHPFSFWNLFHKNTFNSSTNINVFNLTQWNVLITHVCVWVSLGFQEQSLPPKYFCQNSNPKPWFIILSLYLSDRRIWLNLGSLLFPDTFPFFYCHFQTCSTKYLSRIVSVPTYQISFFKTFGN